MRVRARFAYHPWVQSAYLRGQGPNADGVIIAWQKLVDDWRTLVGSVVFTERRDYQLIATVLYDVEVWMPNGLTTCVVEWPWDYLKPEGAT